MRAFQITSNAPYGRKGPADTIEAGTPHAAVQAFRDQHAPGVTTGDCSAAGAADRGQRRATVQPLELQPNMARRRA